jgi:DNA-binding transcriptional LysR family regulator
MVLIIIFSVGKTRPTLEQWGRLPSKPPMKFRHLEYFVAAAEELNFTHAADRLNVSQPPFSKQIHDLEGELGIEFFERQPSALAFVAAGFGVAAVSEPLRKIPAKDVVFRNLTPEDRAWVPVGVAWKPEAVSAPVVSKFVGVLSQVCAGRNGGIAPQPTIV